MEDYINDKEYVKMKEYLKIGNTVYHKAIVDVGIIISIKETKLEIHFYSKGNLIFNVYEIGKILFFAKDDCMKEFNSCRDYFNYVEKNRSRKKNYLSVKSINNMNFDIRYLKKYLSFKYYDKIHDELFQENYETNKLLNIQKYLEFEKNNKNIKKDELLNNRVSLTHDYENMLDIRENRTKINNINKYVMKLNKIQEEPYFARMDFLQGNKTEVFYIGRVEYVDLNICDWRSKLGNKYYDKNDVDFKINSYHYKLVLRRKINIYNKMFDTYMDEYIYDVLKKVESVYCTSSVTDPYLIRVLKKKRKLVGIKDIIATIQKKQNVIIRSDRKMNIIVQGCAGSGKTVILLHRLSYLLYQNKYEEVQIDPKKVVILTPNDTFSLFINELSNTLDLENVQKHSFFKYYKCIYERYTNQVDKNTYEKDDEKNNNKYLEFLYSSQGTFMLEKVFYKYWLEEVFEFEVTKLLNKIKNEEINKKDLMLLINDKKIMEYVKTVIDKIEVIKMFYQRKKKEKEDIESNSDGDDTKLNSDLKKLELKYSWLPKYYDYTELVRYYDKLENLIDFNNEENYLKQIYDKYINKLKVKYNVNIKKLYKSDLYIKIFMLQLFYGSKYNQDQYIFIDEAQDLNKVEIDLIAKVNSRAVFNIYGDLKQNITENLGIRKWKELNFRDFKYYSLNQNYRNSNEITGFCNNKFNINMRPIGISTEEVITLNCTESKLHELIENKLILKDGTKAIICKDVGEFKKSCGFILDNKTYKLIENNDGISRDRINILNVYNSKGLEFQNVIAILDSMNENEKYITCTRALNILYIIDFKEYDV